MKLTKKPASRRLLIVGADGVDPLILERLLDAGQLPNLAGLRAAGVYGRLSTTYPAVSPVAWTSLLTGCWPAKHGILDFVVKAPGGYQPALGLYRTLTDADGRPVYRSRRTASTLAEILTARGMASYLLHVPGTFPATELCGGMLAGLGTPDLLGTFGVPALYASDPQRLPAEVRCRPEVERLQPLPDGSWLGTLAGPAGEQAALVVRRTAEGVELQLPPHPQPLSQRERGVQPLPSPKGRGAGGEGKTSIAAGTWSDWHSVAFPAASGICRFYLFPDDEALTLYRTPLHHSPAAPAIPLSWPAYFAPRLAERLGLFPTASFPMEQAAYQDGLLPADAFLAGAYQSWEQQVRIAESVLAGDDWALCLPHLFTADSLQHLFWPDVEGTIAAGYRWLDDVVGRLRQAAGPETAVMVVSDHGTTPVERWVHLNLWLQREGFLVVDNVVGNEGRIVWDATQAFCLGYGGIYLNVRGREPRGMVEPGRPYELLRQEIAGRLLALRDPQSGAPVVQDAVPRECWHSGAHVAEMPDLSVTLRRGYGLARQDARGQAPAGGDVVEANCGRWRAGHEGPHAPDLVAGVLLAAGPGIPAGWLEGARIVDVAPTALSLLGQEPPAGMDGRRLWAAA